MMIEAINLTKVFEDSGQSLRILDDISFTINKGESIALMGQSGAGKSTLLHVLGGFEPLTSGKVVIDNQIVSDMNDKALSHFRRSSLGVVFQEFNLINSLSAIDNITFVRRLNGLVPEDEFIHDLVDILNLEGRLHHYPFQLSGGEQQRVAIARALANKPAVLLADEPTGNLDETTASKVMSQLIEAVALDRTTLVLVTHSSVTASYLQYNWTLERGWLSC